MDLSSATWRKGARSGENGGNCVEVAAVPGVVAIRDSKDPEGPKVFVESGGFRRLADAIKNN
ncbi:DUF397 domain-containing protein [Actinomadura kijaniata]|uniref:DUF397 domain-containing protein n=1 Tax=Actinomadura kijaniata TaxID=46161 RepID=UPI003F1A63E0